jgi:hypothetical protein
VEREPHFCARHVNSKKNTPQTKKVSLSFEAELKKILNISAYKKDLRFFSLNDFNFIGSFLYFLDCTCRNNNLLKRKRDFEKDIDAFFRENQHLLNNIGVLFFHLSR